MSSRYVRIKEEMQNATNDMQLQTIFWQLLNTRREMSIDEFYELYDTLK